MDLSHRFTVPVGVDEAWDHFNDIASVAECFPGATVASVESDTFTGSVKVKLGPIALQYNGSGTFVEKDEAARRFVVDAKGKDKRGNGTAGALVTVTMAGDAASTDVEVLTDLSVTGKPAQFGRGVMQDVSDKLLGQFVDCLAGQFGGPEPDVGEPTAPPVAEPASGAPAPVVATDGAPETPEPQRPAPPGGAGTGTVPPARHRPPQDPDQALNLATTVLPALARSYLPCAAAGVIGLLLGWLLGRRGRPGR